MEKREVVRKSARTVPVIIENHENAAKKTKLMIPSNYTAGHLANILRSRLHVHPHNPIHLFLKSKQSPVLMSKSIGHLHHKYRDEKGLLQLIRAEQTTFGFRGNIRAIRFRQKWLENHLHNNSHQESGSASTYHPYTSVPPPYFPLDPPSIPNFGAPVDVDSIVQNDDYYDFMANSFMFDMEESLAPTQLFDTFDESDVLPGPPPLTHSTSTPNLSNISVSVSNGTSSTLQEFGGVSSSLSDPWLPSDEPVPSHTHHPGSSVYILNTPEELETYEMELHQVATNIYNAILTGDPVPPHNFSVNIHAAMIPPPAPEIPPHLQLPPLSQLYESDSEFYESDKDLDNKDDD